MTLKSAASTACEHRHETIAAIVVAQARRLRLEQEQTGITEVSFFIFTFILSNGRAEFVSGSGERLGLSSHHFREQFRELASD